ncbi:tRNA-His guanylyltransferase, variant 3 [Xanthoria calcicola]
MLSLPTALAMSTALSSIDLLNYSIDGRGNIKILTTVVSTFTSYYVHLWPSFFHDRALSSPMPSFDGRVVQYPSIQNVRDYLSWRQADCHINNLYNTTFWALVQKGDMGTAEAEEALKGTVASQKNEILFSRFGINYNDEPEQFKKGTLLFRDVRWLSGHYEET